MGPRAWTGSWIGAPDNPSASNAVSAMIRAIGAASVRGAGGRSSRNPPVVGSSPTRPNSPPPHVKAPLTCGYMLVRGALVPLALWGCVRLEAARPVRVNSRVGCVHPGKLSRVHPPDRQTRPRVHAGPQGTRPAAGYVVRQADAMRQPRVHGKPFTERRNIPDLRPDPRGGRPLTNCGQRSGLRSSLPVTLSHRFPNCTSSKGSNPAPYGTRSWRWPKKGLCPSAKGGRRRSQASRPRDADCCPHGRGTEAALRARPSSTPLQYRR